MTSDNKGPLQGRQFIDPAWEPETALVHGGSLRSGFQEMSEAVFLTQGYQYNSAEEAEERFKTEAGGFIYSRYANPTVAMFEERVRLLEGAEAARATASGMAAVSAAILSSLKAGDHIVAARALFGSCRYVVEEICPRFGVEATLVDGSHHPVDSSEMAFRAAGSLAFREAVRRAGPLLLEPIMEICKDWNLPVLIHTNEPVGHQYPGKTPNTLAQIYRMIDTFSQNNIVLAHWGGGLFFFSLLKKEVKQRLNRVFFDTAASPYLYDANVYRLAIELVGVDKILFGSDFPLLPPATYFDEMKAAGLSDEEMGQVCGGNAAKLFNLDV